MLAADMASASDRLLSFMSSPVRMLKTSATTRACMEPILSAICWAKVLVSLDLFPRRKKWAVTNKAQVNARDNNTAINTPNTGGSFMRNIIGLILRLGISTTH
jgi:hypothetical protein